MSVKIDNWIGRTGNNLIQISSAIKTCERESTNLIIPYLDIFESNLFKVSENDSNYEYSGNFLGVYLSDDERKKICQKYIKDKIKYTKINLSVDDLVIHIRGGDVFKHSPKFYVQAPISYINKILKEETYKNIYVIFEDFTNPMVNYLIENYKNVEIINDFNESINYILSCNTLITTGVSTFSRSLSMCSDNLRKLYVPLFEIKNEEYINNCKYLNIKPSKNIEGLEYFFTGIDLYEFSDIEVVTVEIENYIKYGDWDWGNPINQELFMK